MRNSEIDPVPTVWTNLPTRPSRELKGSRTAAHPFAQLSANESDSVAAVEAAIGSSIVVPLPHKGRNDSALNRAETRREVLATFTMEEDGPVLSNLLKESGESLTETQELTMKLQRMHVDSEGEVGKRGRHQTELIWHVERMDSEIKHSWNAGKRVRSLQIAIQACKMLGQTHVPESYPSIFILAAQVLDTFGDFVAERLQQTAATKSSVVAALLRQGQDATSVDVIPPEAVEMCNQWFLKISSIRELLPRVYIELSLMKCYRYVSKRARVNMKQTVIRLSSQIRGVANQVVAAHARWYLFLRAAEVLKGEGWALCLVQSVLDCFATMEGYCKYELMMPAIQWMLDTVSKHGGAKKKAKIIAALVESAKSDKKSPDVQAALLHAIAKAFPVEHLLPYLPLFLEAAETQRKSMDKYAPFMETLCYLLAEHGGGEVPGLQRKDKVGLLRTWWGVMTEPRSPSRPTLTLTQFVAAVGALMRYAACYLGSKQLNTLLQEMRNLMLGASGNETSSGFYEAAFEALNGVVMHYNVGTLLTLTQFLPAVQCLPGELKRRLASYILESLPRETTSRNAVLELCRIIHDGLDELSIANGKDTIGSQLAGASISTAIRMCFSDDAEVHLAFLCECRHSLPKLDVLKETLIHEAIRMVNLVSIRTKADTTLTAQARNKRRTAAKACLSFAHVTAPAIRDVFSRMKHLVLAAQVGFQHGYVAQGETLLQLCLQCLKQVVHIEWFQGVTRDNDAAILEITSQIIALGLLAPPHHKYGSLYVVDSVLQWAETYSWPSQSSGKVTVLLNLLKGVSRAHVIGAGAPSWKSTALLNEGDSFEEQRLAKCGMVLDALYDAVKVEAEKKSRVPTLGQACIDIVDSLVYIGNLEESSATLSKVISLAHSVALSGGSGTIEYVRHIQTVGRTAKEFLGEEKWNLLLKTPSAIPQQQQEEVQEEEPAAGAAGEEEDVDVALEEAEGGATEGSAAHVDPNDDIL